MNVKLECQLELGNMMIFYCIVMICCFFITEIVINHDAF